MSPARPGRVKRRKAAAKRKAKSPRVIIREVMSADEPAFAVAHELLRREFPRAEMLPMRLWRNSMRERSEGLWTDLNWHVLVAERGRKILGAASGNYLGNVNIGIVGYIAVLQRERSLGLGPRLRNELRRRFVADARKLGFKGISAIVGEVQCANPWLPWLVRNEGAIALDFPYVQPSLGARHRAVPLVLYYQPIGKRRKSLPATEVRRLLYTIWRRAYRLPRPMLIKEFKGMMASLRGRRNVGSIKLETTLRRNH